MLRPGHPVEDLDREDRKRGQKSIGKKSDVGQGTDHDQGRRLSNGPGKGQNSARQDAGKRQRKDLMADRLPAGSPQGIGSFPHRVRLKLVAVDGGSGPVLPTSESVEGGSYYLVRPLFIYVSEKSAERPEVRQFIEFYLEEGPSLAREVGYVSLPAGFIEMAKKRFASRITGSIYEGKPSAGVPLGALLQAPPKSTTGDH